jgi:hypothetical protein
MLGVISMIPCTECGQWVDVFAGVCPYCRSNPWGGPNRHDGAYQKKQLELERQQLEQWELQNPLTWCKGPHDLWLPVRNNAWVQGYEWKVSENPSIHCLYQGTNLMGAWDQTTGRYWEQRTVMKLLIFPFTEWVEVTPPWWREAQAEQAAQAQAKAQAAQAQAQAQALTWYKAEDGFWYPVRNNKYLPGYQWKQSDNPQIYYLYKYDTLKGAWHPTTGKYWKQRTVMEYAQDGSLLIVPVTKWVEARPPWWREAAQAEEAAQIVPAEDIQIVE